MLKMLVGMLLLALSATLVLGLIRQRQYEKSCPPTGEFVEVDGHRLHYVKRIGPGVIPLILLHGASSSSVDYQMSLFGSIPEKFLLISIDRPGLGHSQRSSNRQHQMGVLQAQLELINKAVNQLIEGPVLLVTHSLSGVIGARLLSDYPDKYLGMLGLAPALYPIGDGRSWYTVASNLPFFGWYFRNALVPIVGPFIASGLVEKNFAPNQAPKNYMEESCLKLMFEAGRFKSNAQDLNEIRPFLDESYDKYRSIQQPVTLFFGREDKILATFSHAYGFRDQVPHAEVHILDKTGHLPQHFHSSLLVEALDKLVVSLERPD